MKNEEIKNKLQSFFGLNNGWNGEFSLAPPENNIQLLSRIYNTISEWDHVDIQDVDIGDDGEVDIIWMIGHTRYYLTIRNSATSEINITKSNKTMTSYVIDNHNYQVILICNVIYSIIQDE